MSHCRLEIELVDLSGGSRPGDPGAYRAGDEVECVVRVEARRAFDCDRLSVQLGYETHGRGNRDSKWYSSLTLFAGRIEEGVSEFPCVLIVPPITGNSPATYIGHLVNVDWFVRARADVPWAIDPEEQLLIEVDAFGDAVPFDPPGVPPTHEVNLQETGLSHLLVAFLILAAGGYVYRYVGHWWSIPLLGVGAHIIGRFLRERASSRRIGRAGFGVWPRAATPGSEVRAYVSLEPPRSLDIDLVRVRLRGEERATSGSGTNETTHTHEFESSSETLLRRGSLEGGELWEAEAVFHLPQDAPATFSTGDNEVVWELVLEVSPRERKSLRAARALPVGEVGSE